MAHPAWEQPGTDGLVTVCCKVYETKPYRFLNTSVEAAPFRSPIYLFTAHFFVKPAVQDWGSSARGRFEHTWGTHGRPGEMQRGWGIPCVPPPPCCQHLPPCPASCRIRICSPSAPDKAAQQGLWTCLWEQALEGPFRGPAFKAGGQWDQYDQERDA